MWNVHNQVNVLRCTVLRHLEIAHLLKMSRSVAKTQSNSSHLLSFEFRTFIFLGGTLTEMYHDMFSNSACCKLIKVCRWLALKHFSLAGLAPIDLLRSFLKVSGAFYPHCIMCVTRLTERELAVDPGQSI